MRRLSLFAIPLGLLAAPVAQAEPAVAAEEALRFQYTAPAECPNVEAFIARVHERTARVRLASEGELARTFTLAIASDNEGFLGSVEFLDDAGGTVSRRVRGRQCDEVVSSLALITALALDARLPEEPEPTPAEPALPPPPKPAPAPPTQAALPASRWERDTGRGPSARVGASGGYSVPLEAFDLGLLGQLDWARGRSPIGAVRLRAHFSEGERAVDAGRFAELRLLALEASACPQGWRLDPVVLYGCLGLDLGSLRGRGVQSPDLPRSGSATILWVSVAAELRMAWEPDAPFWLELNGQLGTPLVKHTFRFLTPEAEAFVAEPGLSAGATIVSGVRFF